MTIGNIIGSRISNVLETVLRFGCGIAVIGVATQMVSHVATSYRTWTKSLRSNMKEKIKDFEAMLGPRTEDQNKTTTKKKQQHKSITTSLMVQWHVEMLSSLVMLGIFIVACELAVGDFTENLVQSLSVGIGFGLKDILADAVYGTMVMMQGYGKVGMVVDPKTKLEDENSTADSSALGVTPNLKDASSTADSSALARALKYRICQTHLTHVVLIKENTAKSDTGKTEYIVKRWSDFYNNLRYTMPRLDDAPTKQ